MIRLQAAIEAATLAGDMLRRKLNQARSIKSKGLRDIVTDADVAAQELIVSRLRADFPQDQILAEEGLHEVDLSAPTPTWVIDPLDGTSNYARRLPIFGVSIGLLADGELQAGVIYDPVRRELFYVERGQGAHVLLGRGRPRRLAVSATPALEDAIIAYGWPRLPAQREQALRATAGVGAVCHTLRITGSATLTLAYVAAGRLDGSFHLALAPWDAAAGALLIAEAGGQLSRLDGSAWRVQDSQFVTSNRSLHAELLQALA